MEILTREQWLGQNPVLIPEGECAALRQDSDGRSFLRIAAAEAGSVSFLWDETEHPCSMKDGIWETEYPAEKAMRYVQLLVDGAKVLTPLLPIAWGYSGPHNYVELDKGESFYSLKEVPHGELRRQYYRSSITGNWESLLAYTPPGYDEEPDRIFPILYLQHGHGENETSWAGAGKVDLILDATDCRGQGRTIRGRDGQRHGAEKG